MSIHILILCILSLQMVSSSLRVFTRDRDLYEYVKKSTLRKLIDAIYKLEQLSNEHTFDHVQVSRRKSKHHHHLRASKVESPPEKEETPKIEEKAARVVSKLIWHPYVERKGRNDYLVLQSDNLDPFISVIPNSIYYDIEKTCVNWLDACSMKGIRDHLLKKVQSPYK